MLNRNCWQVQSMKKQGRQLTTVLSQLKTHPDDGNIICKIIT